MWTSANVNILSVSIEHLNFQDSMVTRKIVWSGSYILTLDIKKFNGCYANNKAENLGKIIHYEHYFIFTYFEYDFNFCLRGNVGQIMIRTGSDKNLKKK